MAAPSAPLLGVIGGSSFLKSEVFALFRPFSVDTPHGRVRLYRGRDSYCRVIFVQRHAAHHTHAYSPPHLINTRAIVAALRQLGCVDVVGFGSVGTLRPADLPCGTLVCPHDYANARDVASAAGFSGAGHLAPGFDAAARDRLLECLAGFKPRDRGVYGQTTGPRFETPAEVRHLAEYADVVGMTCAHEATLLAEAGLRYALVCMVDNLGNGLDTDFSVDDFHEGVKRNQATMDRVMQHVLKTLAPAPPAGAAARRTVDLVVSARHVVPVRGDAPGEVLERHAVVVHEGRIVDVLPQERAWELYDADEHADLGEEHALMPGLVNTHTHVGMSALRGFADDYPLMEWLGAHIWPAEGRHVSPEFVRAGAELAMAEMVRGGTTAMMDQYFYPQATAEAAAAAGFRASVGAALLDFPTPYCASFDEYLARAEELAAAWKDHALVRVSLAPHAPYTVCDANLERVRDTAARHGVRVQMHVHETADEVQHSREQREGSMARHRSEQRTAPLANLERLGLLSPAFTAVHMTQLDDDEVAAAARLGISVAHCPHSNMKLASGVCRVQALLDAGVNVSLGTDGVASNNAHDMFAEMKTAALLAKVSTGRADALPAAQALRMATLNGAVALGLGDETGSLEKGKSADMAAVRLADLEVLPVHNVVSHLVYASGRENVTDVWVAGRRLLRSRQLQTIDEERVRREAREWGVKIAEAAAAAAAEAAAAKKDEAK